MARKLRVHWSTPEYGAGAVACGANWRAGLPPEAPAGTPATKTLAREAEDVAKVTCELCRSALRRRGVAVPERQSAKLAERPMHFIPRAPRYKIEVACGAQFKTNKPETLRRTTNPDKITCGNCKRSELYWQAKATRKARASHAAE